MTKFTRDAVSEALHAAVVAKGEDYVYPNYDEGCTYSDPANREAPSCIVGHVVATLDPEVFQSWADYEDTEEDTFSADDLDKSRGYDREAIYDEDGLWEGTGEARKFREAFEVDYTTKDALYVAQRLQDLGRPWGVAQKAFDRVAAGEDHKLVFAEMLSKYPAA